MIQILRLGGVILGPRSGHSWIGTLRLVPNNWTDLVYEDLI